MEPNGGPAQRSLVSYHIFIPFHVLETECAPPSTDSDSSVVHLGSITRFGSLLKQSGVSLGLANCRWICLGRLVCGLLLKPSGVTCRSRLHCLHYIHIRAAKKGVCKRMNSPMISGQLVLQHLNRYNVVICTHFCSSTAIQLSFETNLCYK